MLRPTSLRAAFENAKVNTRPHGREATTSAHVINVCARVLRGNTGIVKERDWNAHLSFATAKLLGMPDCLNPRAVGPKGVPSMAYDQMVA